MTDSNANKLPMTSCRPYLLRATYEWIIDNDMTPFILVDANVENVHIPRNYVANGKIILNISPSAVQALEIGNDVLKFDARFNGSPMTIVAPIHATLAIYAKENGRGMVFSEDDNPPEPTKNATQQPQLRVVK